MLNLDFHADSVYFDDIDRTKTIKMDVSYKSPEVNLVWT